MTRPAMAPEEIQGRLEVYLDLMKAARYECLAGRLSEADLMIVCRVTQMDIDRVKQCARM